MSLLITPQTVVSMVVNPNGSQETVFVLPGGTVRWATESAAFPTFKIKFDGPSPAAIGSTLTGTIDNPAVVVFNTVEGVYPYKIVYRKADGHQKTSGPFNVRSCRICE
jgi:hypothetical protein